MGVNGQIDREASAWMAMPKMGEPSEAWSQHRTHKGLSTLEFGLLDGDGAAIPGLHVEIARTAMPRVASVSWKITLFHSDGFRPRRVYQIDNPGRAGMRPGDHDFPHEHVGELRQADNPAWRLIGFPAMLEVFCQRCTLTLTGPVPDPTAFQLR